MAVFSYISALEKKERFYEKLSLALLAALLVVTPLVYFTVPEKVLILKTDAGAIENYNSKSALWIFPLIGFVIYIALSLQKHYLVKYRDAPAKGEEPEHATTVWILRLVKVIALAGLIISVLEVFVAAQKPGSPAAVIGMVVELLMVVVLFSISFKEIVDRYKKK